MIGVRLVRFQARVHADDRRSKEQLRRQYRVESELAQRINAAPEAARSRLYGDVYSELLARVPFHPRVTGAGRESTAVQVARQVALIRPFVTAQTTLLEVGAGDAGLCRRLGTRVRRVVAVDVAAPPGAATPLPRNVIFVQGSGVRLPLRRASIDVAYSYQLMEHLHPDDALTQLRDIYDSLVPGGYYLCVTPNRLSGPHDVSRYFTAVASGMHLKEYTLTELDELFRTAGFSAVRVALGGRGRYVILGASALGLLRRLESALASLSPLVRRRLASTAPLRAVLGARVIGQKSQG